jgi:hypothetical protein
MSFVFLGTPATRRDENKKSQNKGLPLHQQEVRNRLIRCEMNKADVVSMVRLLEDFPLVTSTLSDLLKDGSQSNLSLVATDRQQTLRPRMISWTKKIWK